MSVTAATPSSVGKNLVTGGSLPLPNLYRPHPTYASLMPERTIRLVRDGFPDRMGLDTAVSRALLGEADRGSRPETLRLTIPGRSVAFGKHDVATQGFPAAVAVTRAAGFEPFVRLAGGRAAAFHESTVAISWVVPVESPIDSIRARFSAVANLLVDAFGSLGIQAAVGAVPGEYCPGDFSVHVGTAKVAGIGQRLTRSAAHIGGVIVVDGADDVRNVLVPVYDALGLEWDPATVGSLANTTPGLRPDTVIDAMVTLLERHFVLEETSLSADTVATAETLITELSVASDRPTAETSAMNIVLINGPSLNLLGTRQPEIYGDSTLADIESACGSWAAEAGATLDAFQSNHEGDIIDRLHRAREDADGIVINPGAYSHYSYAIRDAIEAIEVPTVEVHLSDITAREEWRRHSVVAEVCAESIYGRGVDGYRDAIRYLTAGEN